ncbi:MAG TPA: NUDIX domain-containing protein [Myxococcota bacterium]|jgi:8-oxo-dGTP diphosphatase|nr:NUDIX domain-containing protein [Myxococcota bacterium]
MPEGGGNGAKRRIRVVAAAVERARDGRYLITRRRPQAVLGGLWEFPGGRVEEGEDDATALMREFEHRLGARVKVGRQLSSVEREYSTYTVELHLYACEIEGEHLEARNVAEYRWVRSDEFEQYEFTPVDEASMNRLLADRE